MPRAAYSASGQVERREVGAPHAGAKPLGLSRSAPAEMEAGCAVPAAPSAAWLTEHPDDGSQPAGAKVAAQGHQLTLCLGCVRYVRATCCTYAVLHY